MNKSESLQIKGIVEKIYKQDHEQLLSFINFYLTLEIEQITWLQTLEYNLTLQKLIQDGVNPFPDYEPLYKRSINNT